MIERMRSCYMTLKVGTMLVNESLKGISDEDFGHRTDIRNNSIQWVLGHLISSRTNMIQQLGLDQEFYADGLFRRGKEALDKSEYPSKSQMVSDWNSVSEKLIHAIENADEKALSAKSQYQYPVEDQTIFGGITFLCFHEAYHIGQIAYIQKTLGYTTVAG